MDFILRNGSHFRRLMQRRLGVGAVCHSTVRESECWSAPLPSDLHSGKFQAGECTGLGVEGMKATKLRTEQPQPPACKSQAQQDAGSLQEARPDDQ